MGGRAVYQLKAPGHPNHLPWNPPKYSSITSTLFFLESLWSSHYKSQDEKTLWCSAPHAALPGKLGVSKLYLYGVTPEIAYQALPCLLYVQSTTSTAQ
ncbi:hypothetical protein V1524DRAFT_72686 [Lipomyces starkeyi]